MKQTNIQISYDEDKLNATKLYLSQRGLNFNNELAELLDSLYRKHVPANVRDFLELRNETSTATKDKKADKEKKDKPSEKNGDKMVCVPI